MESAVIFACKGAGVHTLSDLRGKSFLFGRKDSSLTFWAKVCLAEAGVRGRDLSKYRYLDTEDEFSESGGSRGVLAAGPVLGNPFSDMTPVEAVINGAYDAGVVRELRFEQVAVKEKLLLLQWFQDTPYVLVAQSKLPTAAFRNFQRAVTNLMDARVLQTFASYPVRFEACSEADFEQLRNKLAAEAKFHSDAPTDSPSAEKRRTER